MLALAVLILVLGCGRWLNAQPQAGSAGPSGHRAADWSREACDPAFAVLFAPPHARSGRYLVCPSSEPLVALAAPDWPIEALPPLDAFGVAGTYNRAALARLYGGRRAHVAHGWRHVDGGFESLTLVSPYPDPTLTRLEPGTLIVRLILCCR